MGSPFARRISVSQWLSLCHSIPISFWLYSTPSAVEYNKKLKGGRGGIPDEEIFFVGFDMGSGCRVQRESPRH
jgi:hypothetical protein